jgi:Uma2 family endonuclease
MAVDAIAPPQVQQELAFEPGTRYAFTVDDYYRMAEQGILPPDARVELIEGDVLKMSPVGGNHVSCVHKIFRLIDKQLDEATTAQLQSPVRLHDLSEPEPDVSIIREREYGDGHPLPEDVFLLIEVSDTTLRFDRTRKIPVYAASGIREVWIVDLRGETVTRYTAPNDGAYDRQERFRRGQSLTIEALPSVIVAVDDILPKD